jgi:hypothetical protein
VRTPANPTAGDVEPKHLCGKLIAALIDHRAELPEERERQGVTLLDVKRQADEERLVEECRRIAARLLQGGVVSEIGAILGDEDSQGHIDEPPQPPAVSALSAGGQELPESSDEGVAELGIRRR